MSAEPRSLIIDAGQTGIRALLHTDDGRSLPFEFGGIRTDGALVPQLGDVVARVASSTQSPIVTVSAGISGFSKAETDPNELRALGAANGVTAVFLAHDSVTSYLGALGDELGVVVAAGTGVVTLAVGATAVARIDGWGNLIGDAGSAYWIGRAALDAVMRAYDGRGPATALSSFMLDEFPDLEMAYLDLQADPLRVSRIAAYSRRVTELAETDAVAAAICDAAAAELVVSAAAGLRRVGEADQASPVVCGIGGVLRAPEISSRFEHGLRAIWPAVDIRPAIANALDGAEFLPRLAPASALRDRIAVSVG
ncbi:BadF/BadG/BcrA/BcrD ATPase family protein [Cryobacterium sp. SO2]|uniref:BadF/BadG/BcrA/BcrD ATPase family protein n=1 Tax=Cryobacterium sp. SO2 TaxID=1897060 RepID=UPI00223D77E1|nr:BadF/BadG/BcrA/BcrD ATPase family protein [Cryobacterium sp. SO2]WEO78955.1 BadF/BadG/BcrA/BcrD ATPase family protein [Cryobacterium sp. SO2]